MPLTPQEVAQQQAIAEGYQSGPTPTINPSNLYTQQQIGNPIVPVTEPVPYYSPATSLTPNLGLSLEGQDAVLAENMVLIDAAVSSAAVNGIVVPSINFVNSPSVAFAAIGSNVSATASGGVAAWLRQGTVSQTAPNYVAGNMGSQEPQVIWEGSPVILTEATTNVFKMWYTSGWNTSVISYAESIDGINWTQYTSNPVVASSGDGSRAHSGILHYGGVYYLYVTQGATGDLLLYTATNGVTFSLAGTALSLGASGTWDDAWIGNPCVFLGLDGQWKMLYVGAKFQYYTGLATAASPAGPWTKYVNNPVNSSLQFNGGPDVHIVGNTYYAWTHGLTGLSGVLPTDIYFWSSPDVINWTQIGSPSVPTIYRLTPDEGANTLQGQIADVNIVQANGATYLYYDATANQIGNGAMHLKMMLWEGLIPTIVSATQNSIGTNFDTGQIIVNNSQYDAQNLQEWQVTGEVEAYVDNNGKIHAFYVWLTPLSSAPASASTPGQLGQLAAFGSSLYFCSHGGGAGAAIWNTVNLTAV